MSLHINNVTISMPNSGVLLSSFCLQIAKGEIVTLMGASGCGKSTLLNYIAGHLSDAFQAQGNLILNNNDITEVPAHLRQIGILFQDDLLFPHQLVWENLAFALPNRIKGKDRQKLALNALEELQLSALANAYPYQISGGQRARISLTRLLLAQPQLILLDEPFSKLDSDRRAQFRDWVFNQIQQAQIPTLMVTHDKQDIPSNSRVINWQTESHYAR
ncbi:ABC transporter ATP-binding protein [Photobacterium angustum]|uniref:ATP-binding cassette domain-containing protein n=1 Tax=Photobacterium angustum TaxID=661 RepID=UPI0005DD69B4|nr:ATP-binding cassette domain-containing protein [Photobacterium angustum]KJF92646.1 ABC transporter ATP-binding protein [Photobacterium angustum]KJG07599.1 ABC transporter ATP-binding protein [Photobacterium angustum]PSV96482.1 ABC transporter ATP-binding protein [Photobacterium angustum]PSW80406.1 ABC transporter ATP-binding protein [Photobacterium angustum]